MVDARAVCRLAVGNEQWAVGKEGDGDVEGPKEAAVAVLETVMIGINNSTRNEQSHRCLPIIFQQE